MKNLENQVIDLPNPQNPNRKFKMKKQIGSGSQGIVYLAQPINWNNVQHDVAIKIQQFIGDKEYQLIDELINYQQQYDRNEEFKSQIVKIYEKCTFQDNILLIMELGQNDFYKFQKMKVGQLSLLEKIKIMKQLARPIKYIHDRQLLHRDIKPENYLQVGEEFKLIDFGLIQNNSLQFKSSYVGTPLFQAPEIQKGASQYNFEIDIFSLGVTFMEFFQEQEIQKDQSSSNFIIKPSNNDSKIESKIKTLIQNMTNQTPQFRIKINDVLSNLFDIANQLQNPFKGFNQQQVKFLTPNKNQFQQQCKFQQQNFPQPQNAFKVLNTNAIPSSPDSLLPSQIEITSIKQQNDQILTKLTTISEHLDKNSREIQSIKQTIDSQLKINEKICQEIQTQFLQFHSQLPQTIYQHTEKNQDHYMNHLNELLSDVKEFFSNQIQTKFIETINQQKLLFEQQVFLKIDDNIDKNGQQFSQNQEILNKLIQVNEDQLKRIQDIQENQQSGYQEIRKIQENISENLLLNQKLLYEKSSELAQLKEKHKNLQDVFEPVFLQKNREGFENDSEKP